MPRTIREQMRLAKLRKRLARVWVRYFGGGRPGEGDPGDEETTDDQPDEPAEPGPHATQQPEEEPGEGEPDDEEAGDDGPATEGKRRRLVRLASRLRRRWGRWGPRVRTALFALGGAVVALLLAGRVEADVGPFDATVAARPSLVGDTTVRLAPLGTIVLDTHVGPMALDIRADQIGLEEAERIADDPETIETLGNDVADDVRDAMVRLALRCLVVAVLGGLAGALISRLSWRSALAGGLTGTLLVGAVGVEAATTFDANAVAEPRYTGLLSNAPAAVGDVEEIVERYGEYRAQLRELVANVVTLYLAADNLPTFEPEDDTIRLLHVSDIHLNVQAFDMMRQVIEPFDVDAIVDTGDIVDWGTQPESQLIGEIGGLDVPYVFVRGNHDSRRTQDAVAAQPNAVVLDGDAADVAGLRIWGVGDPRYTPNKDQPESGPSEREAAEAFAPEVADMLAADEPPRVDLMLVHDSRAAADVGGEVPLVLAGHVHRAEESRIDDETILLTEGSTGGAGLRGLQNEDPEPLAASVLYIDPDTRELVAYDRITLQGFGETGVTIDRHVITPESGSSSNSNDSTSTTEE